MEEGLQLARQPIQLVEANEVVSHNRSICLISRFNRPGGLHTVDVGRLGIRSINLNIAT
jgi:hypothetical protein